MFFIQKYFESKAKESKFDNARKIDKEGGSYRVEKDKR